MHTVHVGALLGCAKSIENADQPPTLEDWLANLDGAGTFRHHPLGLRSYPPSSRWHAKSTSKILLSSRRNLRVVCCRVTIVRCRMSIITFLLDNVGASRH